MGRNVNWDEIPDSTLLPEDLYLCEVDDCTEEATRQGARLMYRTTIRVVEPPAFAGTPLYEYFVIGTPDDPSASEAETWKNSVGARRLKRLFKATMIPLSPDVDEMVETLKGQRFVAQVGQEVDDGVRDPKYKGVKRNRINGMYTVGTQRIGAGAPASEPEAKPAPVAVGQAAKPTAAAGSRGGKTATVAQTITCPFCSVSMPRSEYAGHRKAEHPDED